MHIRSKSCSLVNKYWSRGKICANPRAALVRGAMDTCKTNTETQKHYLLVTSYHKGVLRESLVCYFRIVLEVFFHRADIGGVYYLHYCLRVLE